MWPPPLEGATSLWPGERTAAVLRQGSASVYRRSEKLVVADIVGLPRGAKVPIAVTSSRLLESSRLPRGVSLTISLRTPAFEKLVLKPPMTVVTETQTSGRETQEIPVGGASQLGEVSP